MAIIAPNHEGASPRSEVNKCHASQLYPINDIARVYWATIATNLHEEMSANFVDLLCIQPMLLETIQPVSTAPYFEPPSKHRQPSRLKETTDHANVALTLSLEKFSFVHSFCFALFFCCCYALVRNSANLNCFQGVWFHIQAIIVHVRSQ